MKAKRLRNAIVSLSVVACLCFSIGEGLRLTPFPVSVVSEIEAFDDTSNSLHRYGPLDVPARAQSRNKRQVVDYARSEEHTSELQSRLHLVCRLLLEKRKR